MSQSAPAATLNTMITASVEAYNDVNGPTLGPEWTPLNVAQAGNPLANSMSNYAYSAQAYFNSNNGEVIIANRGTIGAIGNLETDGQIALTVPLDTAAVVEAFASAAMAAATQMSISSGVSISAVYTTGHSLGGAESQLQSSYLSTLTDLNGSSVIPAGVALTNVSFDAPGVGNSVSSGDAGNYKSYNFSSQGDIVNPSGGSDLAGTANGRN